METKDFCFLIQAREDSDYFDQFQSDDSDCLVLFFKNRENRKNSIFAPNTSWSEGRNLLLKNSYVDKKYKYYVFMDDDAKIKLKSDQNCGIEEFKKLLIENEPSIGFPDYFWHLGGSGRFLYQKRDTQFNNPVFFDACVNAFHEKTIKEILPYEEKFDSISWWLSQEIMNHYVRFFLDNSVMQFNSIITHNLMSDPYPKKDGTRILNNAYKYVSDNLNFKETGPPLFPNNRHLEYKNDFKKAQDLKINKDEIFNLNWDFENRRNKFWNSK